MLRITRNGVECGARFTFARYVFMLRIRVRLRPFAVFRHWRITPVGWVCVQGFEDDGRRWLEWRPEEALYTGETRKWL